MQDTPPSSDDNTPAPAKTAAPAVMPWRRQIFVASAILVVGLALLGPGQSLVNNALAALGLVENKAGGDRKTKRTGGGRSAPRVVLAELGEARDDLTLRLVGGAVAIRFAELKPRAAGRVTEVLFEGGDAFKAGAPVLRLDDRREKLALERAEVTLKEALRVQDRANRLMGSGSGSEAALDRAETDAEVARIARDEAKEALEDRTVIAPFDGVASLPLVEIGDRVEAGTVIASFDDRSSLLVEIAAPEAAFGRLKLGAPVKATTTAFPGETFQGRIAEIDSRIDRAARTVTIRAELPNVDDRLRHGMSFTLAVDLPGEQALAAPEIALQWERSGAYLWRVRDDKAERAPVRLLARQDGLALIRNLADSKSPLAPGDMVVVEGVQRLKHGRKVQIVDGDEEPSEKSGREGRVDRRPGDQAGSTLAAKQ